MADAEPPYRVTTLLRGIAARFSPVKQPPAAVPEQEPPAGPAAATTVAAADEAIAAAAAVVVAAEHIVEAAPEVAGLAEEPQEEATPNLRDAVPEVHAEVLLCPPTCPPFIIVVQTLHPRCLSVRNVNANQTPKGCNVMRQRAVARNGARCRKSEL